MPERFTAILQERHVVVPLDARGLWGEARPPVAGPSTACRSGHA